VYSLAPARRVSELVGWLGFGFMAAAKGLVIIAPAQRVLDYCLWIMLSLKYHGPLLIKNYWFEVEKEAALSFV
jgi:hypothetical protein